MHLAEQRVPPAEKKHENKIGNKRRYTVPNNDARKTARHVCQNGRDDTAHCDCDPEPGTEKPRADGNRRQIKNEERVLETGKVVEPANEGDKNEATDYDQSSP